MPPIPNETRLTFGQAASTSSVGRSVYLRDKLFVEVFSMWIRMLLDVPNVETRMSNLPSSPSEWVINLAFSIVESHSLTSISIPRISAQCVPMATICSSLSPATVMPSQRSSGKNPSSACINCASMRAFFGLSSTTIPSSLT
uniref:(northern house mosquito) hypothetical protein n=1 Tax=Culex pipiens TaxID=7175 RepID=A0A8D7ZTY2_CULPI